MATRMWLNISDHPSFNKSIGLGVSLRPDDRAGDSAPCVRNPHTRVPAVVMIHIARTNLQGILATLASIRKPNAVTAIDCRQSSEGNDWHGQRGAEPVEMQQGSPVTRTAGARAAIWPS